MKNERYRGSVLLLFHINLAWFCLMINKLFINYSHSCESLILSDNPKKKMIQVYTRTFSISSSLPLYINPPYSTHTFFLQTAQQFTERLGRMLHTLVTSLITSQATVRPLWFIMLFGLWPLPSPWQLPSMCEEEKVLRFPLQRMFGL